MSEPSGRNRRRARRLPPRRSRRACCIKGTLGLGRNLAVAVLGSAYPTDEPIGKVVWLENGRVGARGTHEQLLAEVPGYRALVRAYQQSEVAA